MDLEGNENVTEVKNVFMKPQITALHGQNKSAHVQLCVSASRAEFTNPAFNDTGLRVQEWSGHVWDQPVNCNHTKFRHQICCWVGMLENILCQHASTEPSVLLPDNKILYCVPGTTCTYLADVNTKCTLKNMEREREEER